MADSLFAKKADGKAVQLADSLFGSNRLPPSRSTPTPPPRSESFEERAPPPELNPAQIASMTPRAVLRTAEGFGADGAHKLGSEQRLTMHVDPAEGAWTRGFVQGVGWLVVPDSCLAPTAAKPPPAAAPATAAPAAAAPAPAAAPLALAGRPDFNGGQSRAGGGEAPKDAPKDERFKVAREMFETEKTYAAAMRLTAKTLIAPMRAAAVLSELELAKVFASIEQIADLSEGFAAELERRVQAWAESGGAMADAFLGAAFGQLSAVYVQYVNNYEQSQRVLKQCEERVEVSLFLKHWSLLMRATGQTHASMGDLLIQPVQRLPRYKMLLEQLLKLTAEDHAEHAPLETALAEVARVATAVNEAVRRREAAAQVVAIQNQLVGNIELTRPGRLFVRQASLLKLSRDGPKPYVFVLFSDCLLYAEKQTFGSKLVLHRMVAPEKVEDARDDSCGLQVYSQDKSFVIIFPSADEKEAWRADMLKVTMQSQRNSRADEEDSFRGDAPTGPAQAPVWVPNYAAADCKICSSKFGLTMRRHHCRHCGGVMCNGCSEKCHIPDLYDDKAVRVCKQCYAVVRQKANPSAQSVAAAGGAAGAAAAAAARRSGVEPPQGGRDRRVSVGGRRVSVGQGSLALPLSSVGEAAGMSGAVVLAGWLQKKGGGGSDGNERNWAKGGRRNWKKRWVVVSSTQFISWYDSDKAAVMKGSMALHGAQVTASHSRAGGFWVLSNTRSMEMAADSAEEAARWIKVLQDTANKVVLSPRAPAVPPLASLKMGSSCVSESTAAGSAGSVPSSPTAAAAAAPATSGAAQLEADGTWRVRLSKPAKQDVLGITCEPSATGRGVLVAVLSWDGLAAQAGALRLGDTLLQINGQPCDEPDAVAAMLREAVGTIELLVWRGDNGAEPEEPPPAPPIRQTHEMSGHRRVRVLWDYQAQQDDELSLARGEIIEVMTADGEWWIGAIGDCVGAFPSNYVVPLTTPL